jgi:hypothetical protein
MAHHKNLSLENIEGEVWSPIIGYEELYQVSNYGRVKALERRVYSQKRNFVYKPLILKASLGKRGYFEIKLCLNYTSKSKKIHRLIAEYFIPNPEKKPQVNHIDGNKLNNEISNLEWVNNRENSCHRVKSSNCTSQYTGVSYFKRDNKWRSSIQVNGVSVRFGMFKTEEEAYQKRLDYEKEHGIVNKYL